jgi:hypothetical protein
MKSDASTIDLARRKAESRAFLQSLSPDEKIARLVNLQEQYYSLLVAREENGGKPIPLRWKRWYTARHGSFGKGGGGTDFVS